MNMRSKRRGSLDLSVTDKSFQLFLEQELGSDLNREDYVYFQSQGGEELVSRQCKVTRLLSPMWWSLKSKRLGSFAFKNKFTLKQTPLESG